MKVEKKDLPKSQVELFVEVAHAELEPLLPAAAADLSGEMKVEGFRAGKVPYEVMKSRVGELPILETAARTLIHKEMDRLLKEQVPGVIIGQPQVDITKLAPGNALEFKVIVDILPTVAIEKYQQLNIAQDKAEVNDVEVTKVINQLLESQVKETLVDRAVQDTDKVVVDIKMFLDQVPVDGGQSQNTTVLIGKDYIIPGFDQNLIGSQKGEIKKFSLQYPKEHYQTNLAGKTVDFEVTIKDIYAREIPVADDHLAKNFGLQDLAELQSNISNNMLAEKQERAKQKAELEMLDQLIKSAAISEVPDSLMQNELDLMLRELEYHLSSQGAKLDDYLQSIKKTRQDLAKDMEPEALKRIKSALLIREIAVREKIAAEPAEIDAEITHWLSHYPNDPEIAEKIKSNAYRSHIANQIMHHKTLAKLHDWNITKSDAAPEDAQTEK